MSTSLAALAARLPRKRAFITGAGSGLGLEFARALALDGWSLGLFDVDSRQLTRAEQELSADGRRVFAFPGDVTHFEELAVAVNSFADVCGGLDLMINNAGVAAAGSLLETPLTDWRWIMEINLLGVVHGCRASVPHLQVNGNGIVINIASAAGFIAAPMMSAYSATKAGVIALSESLAGELAGNNVQVSVAMPGFMQTGLLTTARGPERERAVAGQLMRASKLSAADGAREILRAAAAGELHIVLPRQMRFAWRLKRWWPSWFVRRFPALRASLQSSTSERN